MDLNKTILETQKILSDNPEWIDRYDLYADKLNTKIDIIKLIRSGFHEFSPLHFYISTGNVKDLKSELSVDVRYRGQSVATLIASQLNISISTNSQNDNNFRDFDCNIQLNNISWRDPQVSEFRKFFKKRESKRSTNNNKKNEEHNVESLLLTEFSKKASTNKPITGIQPIKYGRIRFAMKTPLRTSNNSLNYSGPNGGGIDIFARTGNGGATFLTVIEVKDENKPKEPPLAALKQALKYGVFIRELLRSKSGEKWYKIFGFKGKIPDDLIIRVACAMPDDKVDVSFEKDQYPIGNDLIECHYIYFKYDGIQLTNFKTSLKKCTSPSTEALTK